MADINHTISQLESILHDVTRRALGYDVDNVNPATALAAQNAASREIRFAWPTKGAPPWTVAENIAFIQILPEQDAYSQQKHVTNIHSTADTYFRQLETTGVWKINWIFYGPNSYPNAMSVSLQMFDPDVQLLLRQNSLFPLPNFDMPVRIPELFEGQWWERVDLTIKMNAQIRVTSTKPYFKTVHIDVEDEKGVTSSADIGY